MVRRSAVTTHHVHVRTVVTRFFRIMSRGVIQISAFVDAIWQAYCLLRCRGLRMRKAYIRFPSAFLECRFLPTNAGDVPRGVAPGIRDI